MTIKNDLYASEEELKRLWQEGKNLFNSGQYFEAHEVWEDLWHHHQVKDRVFIQGLIQLAAGFYKTEQGVLRGARSLLAKAIDKFQGYSGIHRGINVDKLKEKLEEIAKFLFTIETNRQFPADKFPQI